jgi:hypothetical protein
LKFLCDAAHSTDGFCRRCNTRPCNRANQRNSR